MAEQSITDLIIELDQLRARNDAMRGEITTFLEEVGAPNLVAARDRYRRFATAAIELPQKIEKLQAQVALIDKAKDDAQNRMQLQINNAKELRIKARTDKATVNQANRRLTTARAAIVEAKELLESPMYSSMLDDSRRTIRSLDSALTAIPSDIPVTEDETDAAISG